MLRSEATPTIAAPATFASVDELAELRVRLDVLERKALGKSVAAVNDKEVPVAVPKNGSLISLMLCLPIVIAIIVVVVGHCSTVWYCKPGEPCHLPTTGPVRLGSYLNYVWLCFSTLPLVITLMLTAAVRYVADSFRLHAHPYKRAEMERRVRAEIVAADGTHKQSHATNRENAARAR